MEMQMQFSTLLPCYAALHQDDAKLHMGNDPEKFLAWNGVFYYLSGVLFYSDLKWRGTWLETLKTRLAQEVSQTQMLIVDKIV